MTRADLLLRAAVATAFVYPPIDALSDPDSWLGYFPAAILALIPLPHEVVLHAFGIGEILIALWILFGKDIRIPSIIAAAALLAIVLTNFNQFDILFRDVSLALAALALAFLRPERSAQST